MNSTAVGSIILACVVSCDYDYPRLPKLNLDGPGVVTLSASPSVFVLHANDTRETRLTLRNETSQAIDVPLEFTVTLAAAAGTMTLTGTTCGAQLAAGASCNATGNLIATAAGQTGQTDFQVALGGTSATLSMMVMPACPAECGPSESTNCCASSVVPGNAVGAGLAGQLFYRSYDVAADQMHPNNTAPAEVSDFRLDTYEVTVGRFRKFVNAGMGTSSTAPAAGAGAHARIPGSGWDPAWNAKLAASKDALVAAVKCSATYQTWTDNASVNDSLPMTCITWYEAMAFCIWDGGYLPSEAEWNYAASGGSEQRPYPWSSGGSTSIDCSYANYHINNPPNTFCVNGSTGGVNRVGSESPKGDGRWGHADLAGNLREWNLDSYAEYPDQCKDCANTAPAPSRVVRGGEFDNVADALRAAYRFYGSPSVRNSDFGVRCARTP